MERELRSVEYLRENGSESAGKKIENSHQLLHTMFEGITDPLFMLDRDLNIQLMNKAARTYYADDQEHRCGKKRCFEFLNQAKKPCKHCVIGKPKGMDTHQVFERKGFKDPTRIEQITIYPSRNTSGALEGAIIRICDITESKWMEQQLIQREKLASLGLLTSGIVHEINNPNNFAILNIPVLREYLYELMRFMAQHSDAKVPFNFKGMELSFFEEELFSLVDDIELGAKRINAIIYGLGKYVRERTHEDKCCCDFKSLVEKTVEMCRPQIDEKTRIQTFISEKCFSGYTDPNALEQVLINLIINAAHAADKKESVITIDAQKEGEDGLFLQVRDNGCGMDEAVLRRIFDPFFTTKPFGAGTGLGLYLSYNIINRLGGTIAVDSTPNIGSCFTVRIPISGEEG